VQPGLVLKEVQVPPIVIAKLARAWPMVRSNLPPICSMAAEHVLDPRARPAMRCVTPLLALGQRLVALPFLWI
jgi:hypothetical protein